LVNGKPTRNQPDMKSDSVDSVFCGLTNGNLHRGSPTYREKHLHPLLGSALWSAQRLTSSPLDAQSCSLLMIFWSYDRFLNLGMNGNLVSFVQMKVFNMNSIKLEKRLL